MAGGGSWLNWELWGKTRTIHPIGGGYGLLKVKKNDVL
jgi:hypothetical protein